MTTMKLTALSEADIQKLHQQSLDVLEKVGIKITHDEALKKLKKAGAQVSEQTQIAKFPPELVRELLALAPSVAPLSGINGKLLNAGGGNRYYSSLILDPFINDFSDGVRPPKLEDVRRHTIIGESLDRITSMMRMQLDVSDVPGLDSCLKTMEIFLCHLTKHVVVMPASVENCRQWMEVYEVIGDAAGLEINTTPLLTVAMAVTSPLQIHGVNIDIMKMALQRCYPILSTVCPMAGTTSPYSLAGTALLCNVEALAPVLIAQIYKPGHPVFYSFGPSVTDLSSGHDLYYKAEKMLWKTLCCQIGRYYNLPIANETGGSLTHLPDMQNGAESMAYMLASHLAGQNLFGGVGSMGNANGMSAEQIIMQCGLIDMAEYLARGIDMTDHKLAFDSIAKVGPGGNYLIDELTLELMRTDEFFQTPYFDTTGGYQGPSKGIYQIAHETAESLVNNYRATAPDKVIAAIKEFFRPRYQNPHLADI